MNDCKMFIPVVTGEGAVEMLGVKAKECGVTKMLVVVDPMLKEVTDKVVGILKKEGIDSVIFNGVVPDPTDTSVYEAHDVMVKAGGVDGIVGIGGGSAMDTAKAVNCSVNNPIPLWKHAVHGGMEPMKPGLPLFLIPSTAGTGAEVTTPAVITWVEHGFKSALRCYPSKYAFVDPSISKGMPANLTAATGIDALCHAAECLTIIDHNPVCDAWAKEAIRTIYKWLPVAVRDGSNMEARENMGNAAMLAGLCISNTIAHLAHAFGQSLGAKLHKPHGVTVGVALPCAMDYIADVFTDRVKMVGECMGLTWTGKETPEEVGKRVGQHIYAFNKQVGLATLADLGVTREEALSAAEFVRADTCFKKSPKTMTDEQIVEYLGKIYDGVL